MSARPEDPTVDLGDEAAPWRFRVVRHDLVDPRGLIEHPDNWRAHPDNQRRGFLGAVRAIGFIGEVFVSVRSGRILDGHMRVAEAIATNQAMIPVGWVDCESDEEEYRILASYDPIGTLAELDLERHRGVLERANLDDAALLAAIAGPDRTGVPTADPEPPDTSPIDVPDVWGVVIECANERDQAALLEEMTQQGYTCRALMS